MNKVCSLSAALCGLALALVACIGQTPPSPPPPGPPPPASPPPSPPSPPSPAPTPASYTQLGLVILSENTSGTNTVRVGTSVFVGLSAPIAAVPSNHFGLALDECDIRDSTTPPSSAPGQPGSGAPLGAGASLTVSGTNYSATLDKGTATVGVYSSFALPPFPSSLSLSIPGASGGFPAMSADFPAFPNSFVLTASSGLTAVTQDTSFTWTGAATSGSVFVISGSAPKGNDTLRFTCFLTDDGSFAFSAPQRAQLGSLTGKLTLASRGAYRAQTQGQAALLLGVLRGTAY